jgi:dTMP kinase
MFIVLEGIDGAGTGTQLKETAQALRKRGFEVEAQEFPDHDHPLYRHLIHPSLHGEISLAPDEIFLLFLADQLRFKEEIGRCRRQKKIFLADRYFAANLVYNCAFPKSHRRVKGVFSAMTAGKGKPLSLDQALAVAEIFGLALPDLTVFLAVDSEIAVGRKRDEEGHAEGLDRFESSVRAQEQIRRRYEYLIDNSVLCSWVVVDGEASIAAVTESIIEVIDGRLEKRA